MQRLFAPRAVHGCQNCSQTEDTERRAKGRGGQESVRGRRCLSANGAADARSSRHLAGTGFASHNVAIARFHKTTTYNGFQFPSKIRDAIMKLSQLSADDTAPRPKRTTVAGDESSFIRGRFGVRSMAKTRNTTDDSIQSPSRMGVLSTSNLPQAHTRLGPTRGWRLAMLSDG